MKSLIKINFADSWVLTKSAFVFLSKNQDLNLFPILSLGVILLALAGIVSSLEKGSYEFYAATIFIYLLAALIVNLLNTAFVAIVLRRLNKKPASIQDGLKVAKKRMPNLLLWTLLANTLGFFGVLIDSFRDPIQRILGYSMKFSWDAAQYFFLPILIVENMDPLSAMKQSADIIGTGWKNTISVKIFAVLFFVLILLFISDFLPQFPPFILHLIVLLIPLFLVCYLLASVLEMIVMTALFLNHAKARSPAIFDATILNRAFAKEEE